MNRVIILSVLIIFLGLICYSDCKVMASEIIKKSEEQSSQISQEIVGEHPIMALVYLSDELPIRSAASSDSNLACSDELFLQREKEHAVTTPKPSVRSFASATSIYADVEQFPDSYKAALHALKKIYPNWTFVKMNANLDWNLVIAEEMKDGRSLIEASFPEYMYNGLYSKGWAYATKDTLQYYLDPRNGLSESDIFQFELLTYNKTYHTQEAVEDFLSNTFMAGYAPKTQLNYANIFWAVGSGLNVSPFHLASRVYQEQGKGTSPLISGSYSGYEGYYNFFNIGASGPTDKDVYENGLARAKQEGWSDGYESILGGAQVLSANYVLKGQDTLYLQKFDIDGSYYGTFWHQYMQNICAPSSEAMNTYKLYSNTNSLENTFVFKIPVYNNMPATACAKPTVAVPSSINEPTTETEQSPIPRADQIITATNITKAYGSAPFNIRVKLSVSDGKLSYQSANVKVCTVSNTGEITFKGIGKTTITITAEQTKQYKKAIKKITVTVNPKKPTISALTSPSSKEIEVVWKKDIKVTGYQLQIAANKAFTSAKKTVIIKKNSTNTKIVTSLNKGRTYFVRVRSYKIVNGKKQYGALSKIKIVKCK